MPVGRYKIIYYLVTEAAGVTGGLMVEWLGRRTHDSRVEGSPPGHDIAWLYISETGDRLWRENCLGNCNHHLLVNSALHPSGSLNRVPALAGVKAGKSPLPGGR